MLLRVLLDGQLDQANAEPLRRGLTEMGIDVETWDEKHSGFQSSGDALVTDAGRLPVVRRMFADVSRLPSIVVLAERPGVDEIRHLLREGVIAVVDVTGRPVVQAQAVVAAATGYLVVPACHSLSLVTQLDEPPRSLDRDEQQILSLAATRSIEAAGKEMGFSRRQAQRRFRTLCDDLGLQSRLHATVAAARWGLAHHNSTKSTTHGMEIPPETT